MVARAAAGNNKALTANRITNIDQLHVNAWIYWRAVAIRDVLVLVSHSNRTARVFDDVDSTAEIESKVESFRSWYRHILAEIQKSSRTARERLTHLRPSKVQRQTYR